MEIQRTMLLQMNTDDEFGLGKREREYLFYGCLAFPLKGRKLLFQAGGVDVIQRVGGDRWWSESLLWNKLFPPRPLPKKKSFQQHAWPD